MKKSVIVLGKGSLSVKVADWFLHSHEYDLIGVVPNMPESAWTLSLKKWGEENNIPVINTGRTDDIPGIKDDSWSVDLAISVTYDKIIKDWFIRKCKKIVNIHNGQLPQYRGVNPINWALKNKEKNHGVTIHEITPGIDDGPIISMVTFPINSEIDEVIDVYERALNFGWKIFKETIPNLWEITPMMQNEALARYYSAKDFSKLGERSYFTRKESIEKLNLST